MCYTKHEQRFSQPPRRKGNKPPQPQGQAQPAPCPGGRAEPAGAERARPWGEGGQAGAERRPVRESPGPQPAWEMPGQKEPAPYGKPRSRPCARASPPGLGANQKGLPRQASPGHPCLGGHISCTSSPPGISRMRFPCPGISSWIQTLHALGLYTASPAAVYCRREAASM